ncbi:unnamed protein product [Cuscuta epithymum]|uniref:Uncharacterized protein n=1 Tax=Cuscuta epithymum TaxID=186058 RepID=A0AAV0CVR7_9ASTE|nr:unnamed protein product [Cuscuta epithymum]
MIELAPSPSSSLNGLGWNRILHCLFLFGAACDRMEFFIVSFFLKQPAMDGVLHCLIWSACYGWSPSLFFFFGQPSMDGILRCLGNLLWMGSFIVFFFGQPPMD